MSDNHNASLEQMLEEHRELRDIIRALTEFLEKPQPKLGDASCYGWAATLSERLLKLHNVLCAHFRDEELSGVLEELGQHYPRASKRMAKLHDEHDEVLSDLGAVVTATMFYIRGRQPANPKLTSWVKDILKKLERHEGAETELMQRLYNEELGTGD